METRSSWRGTMLVVPFLLLAACGGGGGGSDDGSPIDDPSPDGSTAAPLTDAASGVPVVGEIVADCVDTGVGLVDTLIDAVSDLTGDTLPIAIPHLSDIVDLADLSSIPVIGGLVPTLGGDLAPISLEDLLAELPIGTSLGDLPVIGQLPVVCSSLVDLLPPGAITDPATLLATLGDPSNALGLIPVLDGEGNPVSLILASLPSGLAGGGLGGIPGLPTGTVIPDLNELSPLDPTSIPGLGGLVESLLGILNTGGVGGLPVGGLGGLTGLLGLLGFLLV